MVEIEEKLPLVQYSMGDWFFYFIFPKIQQGPELGNIFMDIFYQE